ncbi:MAG: RNA polymerase sigma-54 factor, partial [Halioglobus sp.]
MKQSLQLKLGQQLTMTPQLQQAIKLLQLSTLDLQQEIQQALDSNPMLEVEEEGNEEAAGQQSGTKEHAKDSITADHAQTSESSTAAEAATDNPDWDSTIPEDLPVDTQWE